MTIVGARLTTRTWHERFTQKCHIPHVKCSRPAMACRLTHSFAGMTPLKTGMKR